MPTKPLPGRLPYATPTLVTYGDAVELTLGRDSTGAKQDGGGKSKLRSG